MTLQSYNKHHTSPQNFYTKKELPGRKGFSENEMQNGFEQTAGHGEVAGGYPAPEAWIMIILGGDVVK